MLQWGRMRQRINVGYGLLLRAGVYLGTEMQSRAVVDVVVVVLLLWMDSRDGMLQKRMLEESKSTTN